MKAGKSIIAITSILFSLGWGAALAQFDFTSYSLSEFDAIIARHHEVIYGTDRRPDWSVTAATFKYRTIVTLVDIRPEIEADRAQLIDYWVKSLSIDSSFRDLYQREILVEQGGVQRNIPIQTSLISDLEREVPLGKKFEIYVIWIGAEHQNPVFLITEFKSFNP